jgi:hypothetical protein
MNTGEKIEPIVVLGPRFRASLGPGDEGSRSANARPSNPESPAAGTSTMKPKSIKGVYDYIVYVVVGAGPAGSVVMVTRGMVPDGPPARIRQVAS